MVVHALCRALEDNSAQVRDAAVRQLIAVCWGRRTAVDALAARLGSKDEKVRKPASVAFRGVVFNVPEKLRRRATDRTLKLLGHLDAGVREAAAAAMEIEALSEKDIDEAAREWSPLGNDDEDSAFAVHARSNTKVSQSPSEGGRRLTKRRTTMRRGTVKTTLEAPKGPQPPCRAAVVQAAARSVKRVCLQLEQLEDSWAKMQAEMSDGTSEATASEKGDAEKALDDDSDYEEEEAEDKDQEHFSESGTDLDDDEIEEDGEGADDKTSPPPGGRSGEDITQMNKEHWQREKSGSKRATSTGGQSSVGRQTIGGKEKEGLSSVGRQSSVATVKRKSTIKGK